MTPGYSRCGAQVITQVETGPAPEMTLVSAGFGDTNEFKRNSEHTIRAYQAHYNALERYSFDISV